MKPLELTIYKYPRVPAWEREGLWAMAKAKRFTDAELAAEYWECQYSDEVMSNWGTIPARMRETRERLATMRRFATRPHALEGA